MQQYRKKPVAIEAIIWDGKNFNEISNFTGQWHGNKRAHEYAEQECIKSGIYYIQTLDGIMMAKAGDYIIKGVKGEFYPCKPDIFAATYEPVSAPSMLDKKTIEEKAWKVWDVCNQASFYLDKGGVNPYAFVKGYTSGFTDALSCNSVQPQSEGGNIDKLEILKRHYFNYYRSSYPSDERTREVVDMALSIKEETTCILAAMDEYKGQSEGGLQWVKASERLPLNEDLVHIRYGKDKGSKTTGFYDTEQGRWYYSNGTPIVWHPDLEWLDESASPSTANTEEERLNKETTGFNTVAERVAYDQGYADHEKVMMQWIEKWDGSTNSGLGGLLARKFKELNTEEGADLHKLQLRLEDWKEECLLWRDKYLNEGAAQTPQSKEQQIAFAEWIRINGYDAGFASWVKNGGENKNGGFEVFCNTSEELYELFLTETKQQ